MPSDGIKDSHNVNPEHLPEGFLLAHEYVVYRTNPHYFVAWNRSLYHLWILMILGMIQFTFAWNWVGPGVFKSLLWWFSFRFFFTLYRDYLNYPSYEYIITSQRVIKRTHSMNNILVIPLINVTGAGIMQNYLGQLLNFGTITVINRDNSQSAISFVPDPIEFRAQIYQVLHSPIDTKSNINHG